MYMYYDYHKILSYNALLNILIRRKTAFGKTYGATKFVVSQFIKKDEQFAYIRRYKPELKKAVPNFFDSINSNNEFEQRLYTKGNTFYCNDQVCGHAMTLATAQDLKSTNFSKVKNIIFDEFIIEEGQKKYYLKNEVFTFLNLIETISRLRDVRIFLLANSASSTNPYFLYFDLSLPYNNDIKLFKNGTILLQYMKNEEYRETKRQTKFGKLIEGTSFEDYAINNNFLNDNKNFIEKKSGSAKFTFAFIHNNITYGVWLDYKEGKLYVSHDYVKNTPFIFATTLKDHTPNTMFLASARKYSCWKHFIENYNLGNVRFENLKIKNIVQDLLKNILLK